MNQPLPAIQQKFTIIDKQGGSELNAQVTGTLFDYRGVSSKDKHLLQAGKGRSGIVAENERRYTMPFVHSLTRHTIW
jgi:hypothetical protein